MTGASKGIGAGIPASSGLAGALVVVDYASSSVDAPGHQHHRRTARSQPSDVLHNLLPLAQRLAGPTDCAKPTEIDRAEYHLASTTETSTAAQDGHDLLTRRDELAFPYHDITNYRSRATRPPPNVTATPILASTSAYASSQWFRLNGECRH